MKFSALKHKFRRAAMACALMASSITGCKSPVAPQKEAAPEDQRSEWVKKIPQAPQRHEESGNLSETPAANKSAQTLSSLHEKTKRITPDNKEADVIGIFNRRTTVPLFFNKNFAGGLNLTRPLPQTSFLYKRKPVNFLQSTSQAFHPINTAGWFTPSPHQDAWKVRLYLSNAFTHYFPSDIRINTSRYNVTIHGYQWVERGSRDFFNPQTWSKPGNNPFQVIDEPSNNYTLAFEKNDNLIFFSHFHPKFFQAPDQVRRINGTIDGIAVNHVAAVDETMNGSYQVPGDMRLTQNQNTYMEMEWEIGYGHRFNLVSSKKFGSISYVPGISAGVQVGMTKSAIVKDSTSSEPQQYNENFTVQGIGGSIRNKLEWMTPKERFGIYYENKTAFYHRQHALLDGTQEYNFIYTANNVGISFSLYNPANHRKYGPGCK